MKKTKLFAAVLGFCALLLAGVVPAQANSITLVLNGASQGTFNCTNTNLCFGNDLTLSVSGSGTNWTVQLDIDTTGNTNAGTAIGAVAFSLTGFSAGAGTVLSSAPGGVGDWTSTGGPVASSGGGCQNAPPTNNHSVCAFDTSLINTGVGVSAPVSGTQTWAWTITGQTFGGFFGGAVDTHVQALFGTAGDCNIPGSRGDTEPCFQQSGQISSGVGDRIPEPTSIMMVGLGLGLIAAIRRRKVS